MLPRLLVPRMPFFSADRAGLHLPRRFARQGPAVAPRSCVPMRRFGCRAQLAARVAGRRAGGVRLAEIAGARPPRARLILPRRARHGCHHGSVVVQSADVYLLFGFARWWAVPTSRHLWRAQQLVCGTPRARHHRSPLGADSGLVCCRIIASSPCRTANGVTAGWRWRHVLAVGFLRGLAVSGATPEMSAGADELRSLGPPRRGRATPRAAMAPWPSGSCRLPVLVFTGRCCEPAPSAASHRKTAAPSSTHGVAYSRPCRPSRASAAASCRALAFALGCRLPPSAGEGTWA